MTDARLHALGNELMTAFTDALQWAHHIEPPLFWQWRARRDHRKVVQIFRRHGFRITDRLVREWLQDREIDGLETESVEDFTYRKLARALNIERTGGSDFARGEDHAHWAKGLGDNAVPQSRDDT